MMLKFLLCIWIFQVVKSEYNVGVGINDITGPPVEANFMGYANPAQNGRGIHIRLYSRAFIFIEPNNKTRFVFVSVDCGMISQIVKTEVTKKLKAIYGGLYTEKNIALSSTHSHSGPGGFHQYILFDVTSLGFVKETFIAMTDGIVQSIVKAHNNIRRARIFLSKPLTLLNANINRSPTSYLANPPEERKRYQYDVDKEMTLVKIVDSTSNENLGMINWFAVHGTSMNNTNTLVSGDNKGYASLMFERYINGPHTRPGQGKFVAAFAQANLGDVSPNTAGPRCINTGKPCDKYTSTCDGKNEQCVAFGPGKNMYESTKIIGDRQFKAAQKLFNTPLDKMQELKGPIQFRHQFKQMTDLTIRLNNGSWARTCKPAMGYSFAAGTTDGPGAFDFKQGSVKTNPFWNIVRDFIKIPSKDLIHCQSPKPILLATGEMTFPNNWQPHIVETQLFRIGQLIIAPVPGEFTTMSGRRLRDAIKNVAKRLKVSTNFTVMIAGLSNTYADYIATYEEFQKQRYEAASTIYGPHTLQAYLSQYSNLTESILTNTKITPGPTPPFNNHTIGFLMPVLYDNPGIDRKFGQVLKQPSINVTKGSTVSVIFVGANPRNLPVLGDSHLFVDYYNSTTSAWTVAYNDADWETKFKWARKSVIAYLFGESDVTVEWDVPLSQTSGKYRIRYRGVAKSVLSSYKKFEGTTKTFVVV